MSRLLGCYILSLLCPLSFLLLLFPFFGWTKLNDGASIWTDSRALTVNLCTHIFAMRCAFHMNINSDLICAPHRTPRIFLLLYFTIRSALLLVNCFCTLQRNGIYSRKEKKRTHTKPHTVHQNETRAGANDIVTWILFLFLHWKTMHQSIKWSILDFQLTMEEEEEKPNMHTAYGQTHWTGLHGSIINVISLGPS